MRLLLINWARVWDGAQRGGGVNGYLLELALELASAGHEVCTLSSGTEDVPELDAATNLPRPGRCTIRRHDDWRGLRVYEVINSPVLAPGIFQFRQPEVEIAAPELETEFARFLALLRPDIVHFHNIEGFSAGCVRVAKRAQVAQGDAHGAAGTWPGARVLFSLHNYHAVCPQVYLMQRGVEACLDYNDGHDCIRCANSLEPHFDPLRERDRRTRETLARLTLAGRSIDHRRPAHQVAKLPYAPTHDAVQVLEPRPLPAEERGVARALDAEERAARLESLPLDAPERRPLENDLRPQIHDPGREPTIFARRRGAMVAALNECDAVLAVSTFVRDKFISLGVRASVIRAMTIGSRAVDHAAAWRARAARIGEITPRAPDAPLRAIFMGYNNHYKGLWLLVEALRAMPLDIRRRVALTVAALDLAGPTERRLRELAPSLASLTLREGYAPHDLPWLLADQDCGIVPSVWWDNGPQTVMEFLAFGVPVVGARLGGIPDFVRDGENGLLFRGNDAADLAETLTRLTPSPDLVDRLSAAARRPIFPMKSVRDHASEMASLYAALVAQGPFASGVAEPAAGLA
ncbi:MAG: glycosyltransferase [Planctomycetota bacterium]|nr:glycosyltransferase [Planctomycetota bacterium]